MKNLNLSIEKKIKIGFVSIIALLEIMLMFFYKEATVFGFFVMFLLYLPDTIISFIRHDKDKWIDLAFLCVYFVLTFINTILISNQIELL